MGEGYQEDVIFENISRITLPTYYDLVLEAAAKEAQEKQPPAHPAAAPPSAKLSTTTPQPGVGASGEKEKFGFTPPPQPGPQTPLPAAPRMILV